MNDRNDTISKMKGLGSGPVTRLDTNSGYDFEPYRSGNPIASLVLIIFGMAIGLITMAGILHFDKPAQAVTGDVRCSFCHIETPPPIRNERQYRDEMRHRRAVEKDILADLRGEP